MAAFGWLDLINGRFGENSSPAGHGTASGLLDRWSRWTLTLKERLVATGCYSCDHFPVTPKPAWGRRNRGVRPPLAELGPLQEQADRTMAADEIWIMRTNAAGKNTRHLRK